MLGYMCNAIKKKSIWSFFTPVPKYEEVDIGDHSCKYMQKAEAYTV